MARRTRPARSRARRQAPGEAPPRRETGHVGRAGGSQPPPADPAPRPGRPTRPCGLAVTGAGPAQLLTWLNTVTHHLTDDVTATAICALYDPSSRIMRWARAGHLPPLWIRDRTAHHLPLPSGPLLGAFAEATYDEDEIRLVPNDTLLLYTDGLIERRDHSLAALIDRAHR
ncbi:SpoIIE family protein phosphatase [Streptomyces sp. SID3343]|nr:SpoIIE family protein phosphatase [Streptomyces sp. SID3343]